MSADVDTDCHFRTSFKARTGNSPDMTAPDSIEIFAS
jgi:hypothetical protein